MFVYILVRIEKVVILGNYLFKILRNSIDSKYIGGFQFISCVLLIKELHEKEDIIFPTFKFPYYFLFRQKFYNFDISDNLYS